MQHNNQDKLNIEANQQEVELNNTNQSTIGPSLSQESLSSTPLQTNNSSMIQNPAPNMNLSAFAANLGIDYSKHQVEFDTRGLNSANCNNDSKLSGGTNGTFDCSKIPLPKAPMGSLQHGLQTLAECFLNKKSSQAGLEPNVAFEGGESELNRQTTSSVAVKSLQKFEPHLQQSVGSLEIQKRMEDNHKFQVAAQRQIRQMGYQPKNDIKQTQNLYDMVESQPKYLIDEKKAQQLDELQPELAKTKLAKALKEVPLLKNNMITKGERPSISALFFAKMDHDHNELEEQLPPSIGAPLQMKKKQNINAPPAMGLPLTLNRTEGNYFGKIPKNKIADQQFKSGNCQIEDEEESYDWNQTTNSHSSCSKEELNHIPSFKGSKLKNMFGSDVQSSSRDMGDLEDKDELMDDIDVLEINRMPAPLGMKRTKSNNLNNQRNLEEEKSEEPVFSHTINFKKPMFQQQTGGLMGFQNFAKAFPKMTQKQEHPDRKIENLHILTKTNENSSGDEQKTVIISVEKCDHEKDSNSKNSDNRESCFSSKSTHQTENISDSRSSCRTPLEGRISNTQSNYGSENFKNTEEFGGRLSHQPTTTGSNEKINDNHRLLGMNHTTIENNTASKESQDDEMSFNQSINNDDLEQQNQEINEFIPYREEEQTNSQQAEQNQEQIESTVSQQQAQDTEDKHEEKEEEETSEQPVEVRSVDSNQNEESSSPLRSEQQQQREVQSLIVPNNSQNNQEGNNFTSLLSLMTPSHERRRPGSFQSNPAHRQSFDSLEEELEMTPPMMPLTLNRQPNIVQQQQEAPTQLEGETMQRNVSLDSTELLEINLEVALPQPLRRQNAIVPQREHTQADDYSGMTTDQIQEAQQAALREAFGGIEEEDIDFEDLRNNLPQLVRRPGIRLTNAEELNNSSSSANDERNNQNNDSEELRREEDGTVENQNGGNENNQENEAREPVIQRRQTLTEIFFNQTRNAAENERREIREMVDRQNNQSTENNRNETGNRDRQADQGANRNNDYQSIENTNRNRDQDMTLRSIFDSVPHFNFLDNRNSQQEGTIRNRMLRPRETRFNFGGSSSGQNEPTLTRINRDRPFVQLYDPSVNYRQLRAQINESNQNTTSANNTNSGQGSSGRDRLGGPNSNQTNSQDAEYRDRDSISSGDEFTRIVTQAHKKSNQASKQAMEIQKFKDMTQFEQGHPKWEQEIEENLSPTIMKNLEDISKNLGVLSVLIYIRLNNFFKMTELNQNEQSSAEVKEAHEQNSFNDSNTRGGIPIRTQNFLVFLAKRIMNIIHYNEKKEKFLFQQLASESVNERDMSVQVLNAISIFDKVFPSIDEINYCVKKDLVQQRELIVYKMIIDLNEGLYRNCLDEKLKSSTDKDDLEKVNYVFIPCCLKFYKKMTQPQMDELILVMKEINNKISEKKELYKDEKNQKELMFFKAEKCNETNQIKGNPVKILLNNFPVNNEQPFALKEESKEFQVPEDFIEFYQDLKLTVRNRLHPEYAFMSSKKLFKAAKIFKEKVGGKREHKGIKHSITFENKNHGLPQLMSAGSTKEKTATSPDSFGSPLFHRSHTVIQKVKGESSSQQNMQAVTNEASSNFVTSSDISIRLQDSEEASSTTVTKILDNTSTISTKYIEVGDTNQMSQGHQEVAARDCGKTTTASSVAETTIWAKSNKCKSTNTWRATAAAKSSDLSKKTAKKLRKQHLKAIKKRVESAQRSAYLLDNIIL